MCGGHSSGGEVNDEVLAEVPFNWFTHLDTVLLRLRGGSGEVRLEVAR